MAFGYSFLVTLASMFVLGWILIFGGIFQAMHAFKILQWRGFLLELLLAILYVVVGLVMVMHPQAGALSVTLLIAAFFLIAGLSRIIAGTILHPPSRGWLLLSGAVTLLLGILILLEWPASGLWVIGTFFSIDLVCGGAWLTMLALKARSLSSSSTPEHPIGKLRPTVLGQSSQG